MKDLFVLTADADMQQVFRAILDRPDKLGIRPIAANVDRHSNRDAGVFRTGPELIRAIPKNDYRRFIIAFDHDGSGCNVPTEECRAIVQTRMDSFTFTDRSATIVIAPELEEWLWQDPAAIASVLNADRPQIFSFTGSPKDRLQKAFALHRQRGMRPRDFELIASQADLQAWDSSLSFRILKQTLQNWFPAP